MAGVKLQVTNEAASIGNESVRVSFDLKTGQYSGVDLADGVMVFKDAWFRIGEGGWKEPEYVYRAEDLGAIKDAFGQGQTLRVWYEPQESYDPIRFLDVTAYDDQPFFVIGWGVKNNQSYEVRSRYAEVMLNGQLFHDQQQGDARVLRGGAGADANFVERSWQIDAVNSAMLTYRDRFADNRRRTIVAGGMHYAEYLRKVEFHEKAKSRNMRDKPQAGPTLKSFMTLTVTDPIGHRVAVGETWKSGDSFFVNISTSDPFASLEGFGSALAVANHANPNNYDFITLCGWMTSSDWGDNLSVNHSPGLVGEMQTAIDTGVTKYTDVAVRLEPDYYCYGDDGDTQQGWYDDEHWAKYGTLKPPYETFAKFTSKIDELGGKVFTYVQGSMPSNDFALAHPEWMLNNDISLLFEDRKHARTLVRYDFSDPEFQAYMTGRWKSLGKAGVVGLKFDYPETAWNDVGGFEDKSYTTVAAYRKMYQMCREGLGPDAWIHERIMGATGYAEVPCTDVNVGVVDLQRVWEDSSRFEPEMASRIGLRWYKQGKAFRYYPDGKSFYHEGAKEALTEMQRRTFLTLVGLLSGRIELGTSFTRLDDGMRHDLTRMFPTLPNGQAFRPADFLVADKHPEVYTLDVNDKWTQVILVNADEVTATRPMLRRAQERASRMVGAPISGNQADTGSLGLKPEKRYHVFDFWNQQPLGVIDGNGELSALLKVGEARVYAVREVEDHPQVLGTNRHVMCGMFELADVNWNAQKKQLSFSADVVGGEELVVTIALPQGGNFEPKTVTSKGAKVGFSQDGDYLKVTASVEKNATCQVVLSF